MAKKATSWELDRANSARAVAVPARDWYFRRVVGQLTGFLLRRVSLAIALAICAFLVLAAGSAQARATPPDPAEAASDQLERMATARFGALNPAERTAVRAAAQRKLAWIGHAEGLDNPANDPTQAEQWGPDRTIRADILRWLYADASAAALMDPSGVGIAGARISGRLDFSYLTVTKPITLLASYVPDGIDFSNAQLRTFDLRRCRTGTIDGDLSVLSSDLEMAGGIFGQVSLFRSNIGGTLDLSAARVSNPGDDAVSAQEAVIGTDAEFHDGFATDGFVDFRLARFGRSLSFKDARFFGSNANGLDAQRAQITGPFYWDGISHTPRTILDLSNASAEALYDDRASWPARGNLYIEGFVYGSIIGGPETASERLEWLGLQPPGYHPRPYQQLAQVLHDEGRADGAVDVLIAQRVAQRRLGRETAGEELWSLILQATIGYGYRPLQALWWIAAFVLFGAALFGIGFSWRIVTPTDESAYRSFIASGESPPHYPPFNALVYSLENFLPVVDLRQGNFWAPNPRHNSRRRARGNPSSKEIEGGVLPATLLRWYLWVHILAGWIITPLLFAGLAGLIRPG